MSNAPPDSDQYPLNAWRFGFLAVVLLASILNFVRLGERGLRSEEVRWAVISRNMLAHSDYLQPTINGQHFYDKPLGSYWLILGAAWLEGGVDEAAARLPSALSGVVAVAFLMLIARRIFDRCTALLAGVVLATCFSFVFYSRTASADAENVAGVVIALWLCLRSETRGGGFWVIGLWAIMAATSLTKGLLGFALPLLVFGVYRTVAITSINTDRNRAYRFIDRHRWLLNWTTIAAVVVAFAIYTSPFLMSIVKTGSSEGLEMVWRENIRRFFDAHNHRGPIYLYAYIIFGLAAPWSVLLPAALLNSYSRRTRGDRFALVYFWALFAFFTLSSSRRSYYLLPILPAVALLVARLLTTPWHDMTRWSKVCVRIAFGLHVFVLIVATTAVCLPYSLLPSPWNQLPPLPTPGAFAALMFAGFASVVGAFYRWSTGRVAVSFAVVAIGSMVYWFLFALPVEEQYRTQKPFLAVVKTHIGSSIHQTVLYRTRETVYYLDPPEPLAEAAIPEQLQLVLKNSPTRWVLARNRDLAEIGPVGHVVLEEPRHPWEDEDVIGSKLVLLEVDR